MAFDIIARASNISTGGNPPYTIAEDFLPIFPQFGKDAEGKEIIPLFILEIFLNLANASISQKKWGECWKLAMGWFIAHFATLWLQGNADPNSGASAVMAAGSAKGLMISKSVDSVSASIDYNSISQDLNGWAAWKLTIYGTQLASMGKLMGLGNMYVW